MSEDVSKFLEQVRELGDRRAEEDEARSRELEEKILADRKERQARRAGTSYNNLLFTCCLASIALHALRPKTKTPPSFAAMKHGWVVNKPKT